MMKNLFRAVLIFCFLISFLGFVHADPTELTPTLEIDGSYIDLSSYLKIDNNQINLKDLSKLASLGFVTDIVPAEKRIIMKYKDSCISLQLIGVDIQQAGSIYVIKTDPDFHVTARIRAGRISLTNNNRRLQLFTGGKEQQSMFLVFNIDADTGIANIKNVTFNKEPAKYTSIYSKYFPLSKDYMPTDMVNLPKSIKAILSQNPLKLNRDASAALVKMLTQANKEGLSSFKITSTYRSYAYQQILFKNKVRSMLAIMKSGYEEAAARIVARPGNSEHQSGLAMDITSRDLSLVAKFGSTPQGKWLERNCWKYGFILRYQKDKTEKTGIIYEPWHFRYLGYPHSKILYNYNLCLEEYHENLVKYGFYTISDENNIYVVSKDEYSKRIFESNFIPLSPIQQEAQSNIKYSNSGK